MMTTKSETTSTTTETMHPRLMKTKDGTYKPIPGPREKNGVNPMKPFAFLILKFCWFLGELGLGDYIIRFFFSLIRMDVPKEKDNAFVQMAVKLSGTGNPPYQPVEGDVYICSFAKCGFHWMGQAALQIAWHGQVDFDHIHQLIPWPEFPGSHMFPAQAEKPLRSPQEGIQIIKTHLKREYLPITPKAKYIVIARDPCDAVVSGYPFTKGHVDAFVKATFCPQQWLRSYLEDRFIMGSWAKHLAGFWEIKDQPNVLFLNFADIKKDTPATIDKMAKFMGVVLTKEERAAVIHRCSFSYMQQREEAFRTVIPKLRKHAYIAPVIRKGKVGGGHELYTKEQLAAIEKHSREELNKLGSDVPYDELFHASMVSTTGKKA